VNISHHPGLALTGLGHPSSGRRGNKYPGI